MDYCLAVGAETEIMSEKQVNNPLHGIKLEQIVESLVDTYGWEELGMLIDIRCFRYDPSVKSSLKFMRRTPWARKKAEDLYLDTLDAGPKPLE